MIQGVANTLFVAFLVYFPPKHLVYVYFCSFINCQCGSLKILLCQVMFLRQFRAREKAFYAKEKNVQDRSIEFFRINIAICFCCSIYSYFSNNSCIPSSVCMSQSPIFLSFFSLPFCLLPILFFDNP